ncbi:MAG: hypothetical protein IJ011_09405 [Clostridia bacterium]|nr:hypothetical protein [Clostridia bacterium]
MKKYTSPTLEQIALHTTDVVTFSVTTAHGGDSYSWSDYAKNSAASADMGDEFF